MSDEKHMFKTVKRRFKSRIETKNAFKKYFRELENKFKKAFNLKRPKPLAIGIRDEIFLSGIDMSKKSIRKALIFYCGSHQYLQCIKEGAQRVGLSGNPTGDVVTADEAKRAYEQCSALFGRIASKNKVARRTEPTKTSKVIVKKKKTFSKD